MEKLIHKNEKFIEHYCKCINLYQQKIDPACEKGSEDIYNDGIKNLIELYKILLKESKDHYDYKIFIRWNLLISLKNLRIPFNGIEPNDEKKLFKELEERYFQIIEQFANNTTKLELITKVSEIKSDVEFILNKIKELDSNQQVTYKIKICTEKVVKCFENVLECWPYYLDVISENEIKHFLTQITNILYRSDNLCKVKILQSLYGSLKAKIDIDIEYGETQHSNIQLAISNHLLFLKKSFLKQVIERCGQYFEELKNDWSIMLNQAYSFANIVKQPIVHPINFVKNIWYAITHIRDVSREIWSYVKENKAKSALFCVGAVAVGCLIGWIGTAVFAGGLAFSVSDLVVGGIASLGIFSSAVTSASSEVKLKVDKMGEKKIDNDLKEMGERLKKHTELSHHVRKSFFEKLKEQNENTGITEKSEEEIKKENMKILAIEITQIKEIAIESYEQANEEIPFIQNEIEKKTTTQLKELEEIKKLDKNIKEILNESRCFDKVDENTVINEINSLFPKWVSKLAIIDDNKLHLLTSLKISKKYIELLEFLKSLEELEKEEMDN